MVLEKLREQKITFNLEELITDFELNIHKSIDEILPEVDIMGCFFHLAKAFKKKVDQKQMKTHYENNDNFRKFIKQAVALSSLPLDDLQTGVNWLKTNVEFEDIKEVTFKTEFIQYIETYWVNGCFPPFVWSTWNRSDDYTNNNQEGYNSKMNKELKQHHPSPGILLSFLRKQITLAEHKTAEAKVAESRPRKIMKHQTMSKRRHNLKSNYEKAKKMRNVNIHELVGEYLSIMGHNVISATMVGRLTDLSNSQDPNNVIENEESNDVSTWQVHENSVLDEIFECENPYQGRKVGISRKNQEQEEIRAEQWWRKAICPSCKKGFNSKSTKKDCHGCDKFTHVKKQCVSMAEENTIFLCMICKPKSDQSSPNTANLKEGFKCRACDFKSEFKYNLQRHVEKKHGGDDMPLIELQPEVQDSDEEIEVDQNEAESGEEYSMTDLLKELNLEIYLNKFVSEGVNMKMLLSFNSFDMKDCMKELGIHRFGDRHRITERVLVETRNPRKPFNTDDDPREQHNFQKNTSEVATREQTINSNEGVFTNEEVLFETEPNITDAEDDSVQNRTLFICLLCISSKQHVCRKCNQPVCNLFCSIQDPTSLNEMHRIHKKGDIRCISQTFECPTCSQIYQISSALQDHIEKRHTQESSRSLISQANSSDWMYVSCPLCQKRFENEKEMNHHLVRVHEYGEECAMYPCGECGYSGCDVDSLNDHIVEYHKHYTSSNSSESNLTNNSDTEKLLEESEHEEDSNNINKE